MNVRTLLVATAVALAPLSAFGQAAYKAEDVVKHFDKKEDAAANSCPAGTPCLRKKKTRAVCIGTDSACAAEETAAAPAAEKSGFDLLITFELGSDRLSDQAKANLREFANAMLRPELSEAKFNVDGHTDARGSNNYNAQLSKRRAKAVVAFLNDLGVAEERLLANGFGESRPRSDDPFAPINRRVEATIRTQ